MIRSEVKTSLHNQFIRANPFYNCKIVYIWNFVRVRWPICWFSCWYVKIAIFYECFLCSSSWCNDSRSPSRMLGVIIPWCNIFVTQGFKVLLLHLCAYFVFWWCIYGKNFECMTIGLHCDCSCLDILMPKFIVHMMFDFVFCYYYTASVCFS